MKKLLSSMTYDEIIFDGRNQSYGAFQLRKLVDRHHAQALFITFSLFVLLLLLFKWNLSQKRSAMVETGPIIYKLTDIPLLEPEIRTIDQQVVQTVPPEQIIAQQRFREFVVKPDEVTINTSPVLIEEILNSSANIGLDHVDGLDAPNPIVDIDVNDIANGPSVSNMSDAVAVNTNKVYDFVQEQPEFPGGQQAMQEFIYKNINYPQVALENGIDGTVTLEFIVDIDGSIRDVKILKDPGGGLGKEAQRVIKSMPKWKPGKQSDTAVKVKMRAPVRFRFNK